VADRDWKLAKLAAMIVTLWITERGQNFHITRYRWREIEGKNTEILFLGIRRVSRGRAKEKFL